MLEIVQADGLHRSASQVWMSLLRCGVRGLQLNDVLSLGLHRVWKRAAVKWSGAAEGQTALDVCCGSGDLALRLAQAVGIDGKVSAAASCLHSTLMLQTHASANANCCMSRAFEIMT